jgi:hypothetical protein
MSQMERQPLTGQSIAARIFAAVPFGEEVDRRDVAARAGLHERQLGPLSALLDSGELLEVRPGVLARARERPSGDENLGDALAAAEIDRLFSEVGPGDAYARVRRTIGPRGEHVDVVEQRGPARAVRKALAFALARMGVVRQRSPENDRLETLAAFVDQYGRGEDSRKRWNEDVSADCADWRYKDRRTFHVGANRALGAGGRFQRGLRRRVHDAEELREPEVEIDVMELLRESAAGPLRRGAE